MTKERTPKTSMIIKEVIEQESGDLVINIRARRGNKHYRLVYQIAKKMVPEIDLEHLKIRVREDVDAREAEANKKRVVVDRLGLQLGHRIPLD